MPEKGSPDSSNGRMLEELYAERCGGHQPPGTPDTNLEIARLRAVCKQLSYVLHGIGHDLREPIRTVSCYADLLKRRTAVQKDPDIDEYLHFISGAADRLDALTSGILNWAQVLDSDGRTFDDVDMNVVLQTALANLQLQIDETRATVVHEPLPAVRGDSAQLTQLMQNLVSNGIKYRGVNPPEIVIKAEQRPGECLFSIEDNGIGIDASYCDRLFDPFQRLHGEEIPGVGLGLTICRYIVERHHGRIWVTSAVGRGSTFFFTLPCGKAPSEPEDTVAEDTVTW